MTERDDASQSPSVRFLASAWGEEAALPAPEAAGGFPPTGSSGHSVLLLTTERHVERAVREGFERRVGGRDTLRVVRSAEELEATVRDHGVPHRILLHRGHTPTTSGADLAEREFFLLFNLTRSLLARQPEHPVRLVYAFVEESGQVRPAPRAVGAFARVVHLERPDFHIRTVAVRRGGGSARAEPDATAFGAETAALVAELDLLDDAVEVSHDGGRRRVRHLVTVPGSSRRDPALPVRDGGTYLVTGGLGRLGLNVARDLARSAEVNLVLTGRRPLDVPARRAIAELGGDARVHYVSSDIATRAGAAEVVRQGRSRFGALNGVVHSAGVVRDALLWRKTSQEALAVLAAKISGTEFLDEALGGHELDFFVLFSSLAGTLGNLGQADYAFANAYLDHFARLRESRRRGGLCSGRTVSIAWPLWEESALGHGADSDRAAAELGLRPLTTEEGVAAFRAALTVDEPAIVVAKGEPRTWETLTPSTASAGRPTPAEQRAPEERTSSASASTIEEEDPVLRGRTRDYLVELVARYTKLSPAEIRTDTSFGRYGLESVVIVTITQELERDLGALSKTLFFEYDGVDVLAAHLLRTKEAELRARFGLIGPGAPPRAEDRTPSAVSAPAAGRLSGKWELLAARGRAGDRPARVPEPVRSRTGASPEPEPIAIVGLAGRYPEAPDLDAFWRNLRDGRDSVTEVPARRWDHRAYFDEVKGTPGKTYGRWGGFLDGVELFDPLFFNIAPAEAEFLDPQERLFLETSWHTIEDAGYTRGALAGGRVGVFVGVMYGLYQLLATDRYGGWVNGNSSYASVANRVSHFFDFHGPSVAVDSMCSSSLVAVHQACASIRAGDCDLALAGGVNVMSHPSKYVQLSQGGFLSTDGRCRSFGAGGDGYVPGEGVGAVLLKPLDKALADGDHVHAVIRGSAVNAGGRTSGYSVPNPEAQAELITGALERAGVGARDISYVEAHGTGTALGDPIEVTGLTKAYRAFTADRQYCAVGSVKSNIGHLESAAGVAALTKVLLQLRHRQLAPSLHAEPLNPMIDFADSPFYVQRELGAWAADGGPRRAAVSAFGAGGTNAHLILEEYQHSDTHGGSVSPPGHVVEERREWLFPLSAQTDVSLTAQIRRVLDYLDGDGADSVSGAVDTDRGAGALRREVRSAVAEALGLEQGEIDDEERYLDLGLDPYALARVQERLWDRLAADLPRGALHEHPTVAQTTAHLTRLLGLSGGAATNGAGNSDSPTGGGERDLAALAYTLQTAREPLTQRVAVVAGDVDELRARLRALLDGADAPGGHRGAAEAADASVHRLLRHEVTRTYVSRLLSDGDLDEAARLWAMGADVDWSAHWGDRHPRRLSLPGYPFDRDVHWLLPVADGEPLVPGPVPSGTREEPDALEPVRADERPRTPPATEAPEISDYATVLTELRRCFGEVLKIPEPRLGERTAFEQFGLDSVRVAQINRWLEQSYGPLPKSLLFSHGNLESLARYLSTHHAPVAAQPSPTPDAEPIRSGAVTERSRDAEAGQSTDIAIVGLSGRYPQAPTLERFAANLAAQRDSVTEIPTERWDHADYPDIACRWGGFIDDALAFDPAFFSVSPNAAAYMDPQERLFVESVWHCLEDAGYTPEGLAPPDSPGGRADVAVYAGVTFNEYALYGAADLAAGEDAPLTSQLYSVANRISYLLNLRGPSLTVDTACSSSLYAIHLACEAVRRGECQVAVAGGVNLSLHPSKYLTLDMFNFLAPDGHCKSFGAGGDGYVPGEGVGAVLLKPLARAEEDGDHVYGVIKGSAVNHGGRTNGYTVPNPVAQTEVVRRALERSGVSPASISYLEAHGTGTSLGDTIEIEALTEAFGERPEGAPPCAIGSVKSNIGHLEAAAGVSQLTKVLLQMRGGRLFPSRLNSDRLNPEIDFSRTPFRVQLEEAPWHVAAPADGGRPDPRRAGISSFGVGGVNVHLVVEEAPSKEHRTPGEPEPQLLPLSARTPEALARYAADLLNYLKEEDEPADIADIAFTLQTGRLALPYRVAFVAAHHAELTDQVAAYAAAAGEGAPIPGVVSGGVPTGEVPGAQGAPVGHDPGREPVRDRDQLHDLARRWVAGGDLGFERWHAKGERRRVPLPGYPFDRDTYWLYRAPVRAAPVVPAPGQSPPAEEADTDGPAVEAAAGSGNELDVPFLTELADTFPDERLDMVAAYVQRRVGHLLGFTDDRLPGTEQGFFDLGMDSITATQAHAQLEAGFGQELDLQLFFNYPTVRDVAAYILGLLDVEGFEPPTPGTREAVIEPAAVRLFTRPWVRSTPGVEGADSGRRPATAGATILLFDTNETLRTALRSLPEERRPGRVVLVRPGSGFRELNDDLYEIEPTSREDHAALFTALAERGTAVDRMIHFWSAPGPEATRLDENLERGVHALTMLGQAVLARPGAGRVNVLYVFANSGGVATPEHRGVGGFARAVRMDSPLLSYRTVEFTRANLSRASVARALLTEFDLPDQDIEVRHDGTHRWVRSFQPVARTGPDASQGPLTQGGVYLVTGGLGGLAELVAGRLCRDFAAKVVLVGRSEADTQANARLGAWCANGAEVVYRTADVGDAGAVEELVEWTRACYGRVNGVFHAAGVLRDGSVADKSRRDMDEVFRAKVRGTRHLDLALRDEPLDCFVLFSSLAAVLGNLGQSDTCFASAYLDAFAEYRERLCERGERRGRTLSVNWSFWRDGKLTVGEPVLAMMNSRFGAAPLDADEGWEALRSAVALDQSQVVVVKGTAQKTNRVLGIENAEQDGASSGSPTSHVELPGTGVEPGPEAFADALEPDADPGVRARMTELDAMDERELVALLEKEIELSMIAEDGVA